MIAKKQYNYSKLRGRIRQVYGSEKNFAEEIGISATQVSLILNNKAEFGQSTIKLSSKLLGIKPKEIGEYFFCERS